MIAIVTAPRTLRATIPTLNRVYRYVQDADIYTTYEVAHHFPQGTNRPKSWLANQIDRFDMLVVIGYDGRSSELIDEAEASGLNVILLKES